MEQKRYYKLGLMYYLFSHILTFIIWAALAVIIIKSKGALIPSDITIYEVIKELGIVTVSFFMLKHALQYRTLSFIKNTLESLVILFLLYGLYMDNSLEYYGHVFYIHLMVKIPFSTMFMVVKHDTRESILNPIDNYFISSYRRLINVLTTLSALLGSVISMVLLNVYEMDIVTLLALLVATLVISNVYSHSVWYRYTRFIDITKGDNYKHSKIEDRNSFSLYKLWRKLLHNAKHV